MSPTKTFFFSPATPAKASSPTSASWQFASYSVQQSRTSAKTMGFSSPSPAKPYMRSAMGYFAFPPGGSPPLSSGPASSESEPEKEQERQWKKEEAEREAAWAARLKRDAELRQQRLAQEEAEATHGEEEWVRSGGILRDSEGRRDMVKTQAVREELKLRDIEKALVDTWEGYEGRWKVLLASGRGKEVVADLRFRDVPWPVDTGGEVVELRDLTVKGVEEFLLGGLRVRGCGVTKKERVRSSLLRWHPDKMTGVFARVVEEDIDMVKDGINVVICCLQMLNSKVVE
jgi:hypothetical protein